MVAIISMRTPSKNRLPMEQLLSCYTMKVICKLDVTALDAEFETKLPMMIRRQERQTKARSTKKIPLSSERIDDISKHLIDHFRDKIHPDGHKAMQYVCMEEKLQSNTNKPYTG
jgi:type I site-specific restriction-modification system R (restriction) subunit